MKGKAGVSAKVRFRVRVRVRIRVMARLRFRLRLRLRLRLGVRLRLRVRVRVRRRLAVEVYGEVGRVEVRDLRGGVGHQVGQALGQRVRRARGEHAHELLEGEEGRAWLGLGIG